MLKKTSRLWERE